MFDRNDLRAYGNDVALTYNGDKVHLVVAPKRHRGFEGYLFVAGSTSTPRRPNHGPIVIVKTDYWSLKKGHTRGTDRANTRQTLYFLSCVALSSIPSVFHPLPRDQLAQPYDLNFVL